jgi:hypothetical protein
MTRTAKRKGSLSEMMPVTETFKVDEFERFLRISVALQPMPSRQILAMAEDDGLSRACMMSRARAEGSQSF